MATRLPGVKLLYPDIRAPAIIPTPELHAVLPAPNTGQQLQVILSRIPSRITLFNGICFKVDVNKV